MVAKDTILDTPNGELVIRKDTSNRGGCGVKEKLCDDIYVLYHFIEGDQTMDITKLFTEKTKKKCVSGAARMSTCDQTPIAGDISDFCVQLLTEMRRERDLLVNDIANLKCDSGLLKKISEDISFIRQDLSDTRDRVSKLEVQIVGSCDTLPIHDESKQGGYETLLRKHKQANKQVKKLENRTAALENSITRIRHAGNELSARVSSNNASLTARMNSIDLAQSTTNRPIASADHCPPPGFPFRRSPDQAPGYLPEHPLERSSQYPPGHVTLPQSDAGSTRPSTNNRDSEVHVCDSKEVCVSTDQSPESKPTASRHWHSCSNPDTDQTLPKTCYTDELPGNAELSDAGFQSPSQPADSVLNDGNSTHRYSDRLSLDVKTVSLPLEYEDSSSSDESDVVHNDRAPLYRQDPLQPADPRCKSHQHEQPVHPRRNVSTAGVSTQKAAPDGTSHAQHANQETLRVTLTRDEAGQTRTSEYIAPQYQDGDDLLGFVPVHRKRQKTAALFVSGILLKNDNIEDTIRGIQSYVKKQSCDVKSIHKLRKFNLTMSVKLIVLESDIEVLLGTGFWPEGIKCRVWVQN
jgi:hypothetical protein